jgi:hypothetical protein
MSINRIRVIVLGFLVLAVGSFGASSAYGSPGPFWHHRDGAEKGEGTKIEENSPEAISVLDGEQELAGVIAGTKVVIATTFISGAGIIYNNSMQGQIKLPLTYVGAHLVQPELRSCEVNYGTNDMVSFEGHLAWKWNGEAKQLGESSQAKQMTDIIFTPAPLVEGAEKLPEGSFTTITLKGSGCGLLAGKFKVSGSVSALVKPANLSEWTGILRELTITFPGWKKQHFWNGKTFVGVESISTFAGNPATIAGVNKTSTPLEIAIFEK